jgi:hypothetical protein
MFFAQDLVEGQVLNMLNGDTFTVSINGDDISLYPGGNSGFSTLLMERDTVTLEALVHPIDSVLFPSCGCRIGTDPGITAGLFGLSNTFGLTGKSKLDTCKEQRAARNELHLNPRPFTVVGKLDAARLRSIEICVLYLGGGAGPTWAPSQ